MCRPAPSGSASNLGRFRAFHPDVCRLAPPALLALLLLTAACGASDDPGAEACQHAPNVTVDADLAALREGFAASANPGLREHGVALLAAMDAMSSPDTDADEARALVHEVARHAEQVEAGCREEGVAVEVTDSLTG
jgi:hypothetical protein